MYTYIEPYKIEKILIVTAGTEAQDVMINGAKIIIQNQHATQTVHIKEKNEVAATTSNSYIVYPKETSIPLIVKTLSIIASGATTTVAIIFLI